MWNQLVRLTTLLIAVVFQYCCICRPSLTLRKWDFDIGFVQLRVPMLFYHVSEDRFELKRQRVTDFFPPSRCASAIAYREVRSSIREVCRSSAEVKKRRVETRTEWKPFSELSDKKRLSVVNNGSMAAARRGRERRRGGKGDVTRPRCTAMIFLSARFAICQEMDVNRYHGPGEKYRNLVENLRGRP